LLKKKISGALHQNRLTFATKNTRWGAEKPVKGSNSEEKDSVKPTTKRQVAEPTGTRKHKTFATKNTRWGAEKPVKGTNSEEEDSVKPTTKRQVAKPTGTRKHKEEAFAEEEN
jgi:hypothetical protein